MIVSLFGAPQVRAADLSVEYPFGHIKSLSEGIGYLITPALSIAGLAVLLYFIFGAFKLVFSGGDKNAVAEARGMIVHSIIGFILLLLMFAIYAVVPQLLGINLRVIQGPN